MTAPTTPSLAVLAATALLWPATASAQQTIVSPVGAATTDGSSQNGAPWGTAVARRYLQIHSDIGGSPKVFTQIAFRRNQAAANTTGTRIADFELFMGSSVDWDKASFFISSNYTGPRTMVMARKVLTLGPLVGTTTPPPFEVKIPLDTPYVYTGTSSFAWEVVVYSNAASGTFPILDADEVSYTTASPTVTGPGCVASGRTNAMIHSLSVVDCAGLFTLGGYVDYGPANAPTVFYIGSSNPSQAVPGLCGPLYTDLLAAIPIGLTDATGFIGEKQAGTSKIAGGAFVLLTPNTFSGATIFTQVHSLDAGSTLPLQIANSDGRRFVVPTINATRFVRASRIYNHDGGVSGNTGQFFGSSSVGYGLVTEFTY